MRAPRLLACAGLLAACDEVPQATTDYRGEAMAQVRGVLSSRVDDVPDGMVPFILWEGIGGGPVDVVVRFPTAFTIDFYQPPHDEELIDFPALSDREGEVRVGVGSLELLPIDVTEEGTYPIGLAERHVIVYAEDDMAEGTLGADHVGAALTAGYHVVKVIPAEHPSCRREFDCLRYSSLDLETSIEVRIDRLVNLDPPHLDPWIGGGVEDER